MHKVSMIKIEDCKDGFLYFIEARNAQIGIYSKDELGFIISRHKFNDNYLFTEYHWDIGKINQKLESYGTAKPIKEIGPTKLSFLPEMNEKEKLKFLNDQEIKLLKERETYQCDDFQGDKND